MIALNAAKAGIMSVIFSSDADRKTGLDLYITKKNNGTWSVAYFGEAR